MEEIFRYLNKFEDQPSEVVKQRIQNTFGLSKKETEKVYSCWKSEYMKPKINYLGKRYSNKIKV